MDWLKLLVQRRMFATGLRMLAGWAGMEASDSAIEQFVVAAVAAAPVLFNLLSYFSRVQIAGLEPAMLSGIIGVLAAVASALGVPIPEPVLQAAGASTAALVAASLELSSSISTNRIQPTGVLASKNP